ncbi:MAG TPA: acetate--CoA ligase family protein [Dissulfurispiraceae bacterium]|nr:acetate--CoA ligase family protein [Dissulfurispiraceae bacterium]
MLEHEAKAFLREMGLPVPDGTFFKRGSVPSSAGMMYPLIAKVSSEHIISKSEVLGIKTGITNEEELNQAVAGLMQIPGADGVLVEETAPHGVEVIIGGIIDPQFGPVMMFGLGGVNVEVFKDVAFGLAPLDEKDALWLIAQIKGHILLEGYRGSPPADTGALIGILIAISRLMTAGRIREIDLNPVAVYPAGAMILDVKMSLI